LTIHTRKSFNRSIGQSLNRSVSQSCNKSLSQSLGHLVSHSTCHSCHACCVLDLTTFPFRLIRR